MNIKLDQDVRIRLSEEDMTNWKPCNHIVQTFSIGAINFLVILKFDSIISKSHIYTENDTLVITLTADDYAILISNTQSSEGISIDDINIQVDRWSKMKRERHDERMKAGDA